MRPTYVAALPSMGGGYEEEEEEEVLRVFALTHKRLCFCATAGIISAGAARRNLRFPVSLHPRQGRLLPATWSPHRSPWTALVPLPSSRVCRA